MGDGDDDDDDDDGWEAKSLQQNSAWMWSKTLTLPPYPRVRFRILGSMCSFPKCGSAVFPRCFCVGALIL